MPDGRDVTYLYDGSFDGLLTCIFESVYRREMPTSIEPAENVQQSIMRDYVYIASDEEKAQRVFDSIETKISHEALVFFYYVYLSDLEDKERILLEYLLAGYKLKNKLNSHLLLDCVNSVVATKQRVGNEAHNIKQFLRFSELANGVYYARISPRCRVLPIISSHFKHRFPTMPWIIHDCAHNECMVYNGKTCELHDAFSMPDLEYSENEMEYRRLWKSFYDTIEVKERHNERCRMNHMPKKYWRYMPEMWEA